MFPLPQPSFFTKPSVSGKMQACTCVKNSMLPEAEQQRLLFEGGYPVLAKVAKRKGLPYPHVNQQGEIEADADWWATMQAAG